MNWKFSLFSLNIKSKHYRKQELTGSRFCGQKTTVV